MLAVSVNLFSQMEYNGVDLFPHACSLHQINNSSALQWHWLYPLTQSVTLHANALTALKHQIFPEVAACPQVDHKDFFSSSLSLSPNILQINKSLCQSTPWFGTQLIEHIDMKLGVNIPWDMRVQCSTSPLLITTITLKILKQEISLPSKGRVMPASPFVNHGVMVSTYDFHASDPGSNCGRTYFVIVISAATMLTSKLWNLLFFSLCIYIKNMSLCQFQHCHK